MQNAPKHQRKKLSPLGGSLIALGLFVVLPIVVSMSPIGALFVVAIIIGGGIFLSNRQPKNRQHLLPAPPEELPAPPEELPAPSEAYLISEWVDFVDSLDLNNPSLLKRFCRQAQQTSTNPRILLFSATILEDIPAIQTFITTPPAPNTPPAPLSDTASILLILAQHLAQNLLPLHQYFAWVKRLVDATEPLQFIQQLSQLPWLLDASCVTPFINKALASGQPKLVAAAQDAATQYEAARLLKLARTGDLPAIQTLIASSSRYPALTDRAALLRLLFTSPPGLALFEEARAIWAQRIAEAVDPAELNVVIDQMSWIITPASIENLFDSAISSNPTFIKAAVNVFKSDDAAIGSFMQKALATKKPKTIADTILEMGRQDIQQAAFQWVPLVKRFGKDVDLAIAQALGFFSCNGFETTLRELLSHMDLQVAVAAAESLGKKGSLADLPALRAFVASTLPDSSHRKTAQAAISQILERDGSGASGDLALVPSASQNKSPSVTTQFVQAQNSKPIPEQWLWEAVAKNLNLRLKIGETNRFLLEGTRAGLMLSILTPKAEGDDVIFQIGEGVVEEAWSANIQRGIQTSTWKSTTIALNTQGLAAAVGSNVMLNAAILSPAARENLAKLKLESRVRWDGARLQISVPNHLVSFQMRLDLRHRAGQQKSAEVETWLEKHIHPLIEELTVYVDWMAAWIKTQRWPTQPLESLIARLWNEPSESLRWSALQLIIERADEAPDLTVTCCREGVRRGNSKERLLCAAPILDDASTIQALKKDPNTIIHTPILSAWSRQPTWSALTVSQKFQSAQQAIYTTEPTARASLLDQLTQQIDKNYTEPLLQQAMQSDQPALIATAILALARYDMQREARDWVRLLYRFSPKVDEAIARAFGLLSCGGYENRLNELLKHPTPEVQIAAAESLGKKGSLADVPALRALIPTTSAGEPLYIALQSAIEHILKRAGGLGQHGDLALIDSRPEDAGALSFPKAQQGQEGALSLPGDQKNTPYDIK